MKTYTRLRTQREVEEGHGHRHSGVGARYNVDLVAIPVSFNRIKQLVYVSGFVLTLLIIIKATCNYLKMILNNPRESQWGFWPIFLFWYFLDSHILFLQSSPVEARWWIHQFLMILIQYIMNDFIQWYSCKNIYLFQLIFRYKRCTRIKMIVR